MIGRNIPLKFNEVRYICSAEVCGGLMERRWLQIMGLIENMSYFKCPSCGERSHVFGHGGARSTAEEMDMEFLGEVAILSEPILNVHLVLPPFPFLAIIILRVVRLSLVYPL